MNQISNSVINKYSSVDSDEYIGKDIHSLIHWFIQSFQSENTKLSYSKDLEEFFLFSYRVLKIKIINLKQITERLVILWKESLKLYSIASISRKISVLSSFLTYSKKRGLIDTNIVEFIKKPKSNKISKTNALNNEEIFTIIEFAKKQFQIIKSKENRSYRVWRLRYTVLYVLFTVGLRVEELCGLKIKDFENTDHFSRLHLKTKGNLVHSPIIHSNTAKVLLDYKNEFRFDATPDEYFFIRVQLCKNITKLNRSSIFDMVKITVKESRILKEISPHSFRATLATQLHLQGIPIVQIQNLLNHKLTATTSIYIKKSSEIQEAASQKIKFLD